MKGFSLLEVEDDQGEEGEEEANISKARVRLENTGQSNQSGG